MLKTSMKRISSLCVVVSIFILAGCTASDGDARRALRALGLTSVVLEGYPWFACANDDVFNSAFTAMTRDGQPVSGAVCCGWMKGCTVRFR